MNSRALFAAVAVIVLASGCVNSTNTNTGEFELMVSDQPAAIDDFERLDVTFSEARVFRSTGDNTTNASNSSGDYETFDLDSPTVDLTQVKGAKAESILNASLEAGNYSKVELYVESTEGIVNGSEVDVKVPPGKLMITKPFEIAPNSTTQFVFDIQVVLRGNQQNNQGYILKPVISESGVAGEDVELERSRGGETPPPMPSENDNMPPAPGSSGP